MIHRLQSNRHSCFVVYKALQDQPARSYMHTLCIAVTVAKQTQFCSQTSNIRLTRYASCKCWQSCTLHACECACVSQHTLGWLLSNVIIKPGLCSDVQERHMTVQDVPAHVKTCSACLAKLWWGIKQAVYCCSVLPKTGWCCMK